MRLRKKMPVPPSRPSLTLELVMGKAMAKRADGWRRASLLSCVLACGLPGCLKAGRAPVPATEQYSLELSASTLAQGANREIVGLAFTDSGKYLVARFADATVGVFEFRTGRLCAITAHPDRLFWRVTTPDGHRYMASECGSRFQLRPDESGPYAKRLLTTSALALGIVDYDAALGSGFLVGSCFRQPLRLWDLTRWEAVSMPDSEDGEAYAPRFLRGGSFLLHSGHYYAVSVWSLEKMAITGLFAWPEECGEESWYASIYVCPNESWCVCIGPGGALAVLDLTTAYEPAPARAENDELHIDAILRGVWASDVAFGQGDALAFVTAGKEVRLWRRRPFIDCVGVLACALPRPPGEQRGVVALRPEDKYLVHSCGAAFEVHSLRPPQRPVLMVVATPGPGEYAAYTPHGHFRASKGAQTHIRFRRGSRTYTPAEYARVFRWHNRPEAVQLPD
mgnify:CR=1 FL=1